MVEILEKLLLLQERDQRLQTLMHEINHSPGEKAALENELREAHRELDQAKTRAKEIEVERARLEVEAGAKRTQAAKYRTQQMETRKNEEYAALGHEIERAEKDITAIEDRELELMQEAEDLKPTIAEADKKFAADKVGVLQGRADEVRLEREGIAAEVRAADEDLVELYEKLFSSKMGRAIVQLEGDHCTGCHMKVTPTTVRDAKVGTSIVSCEQCGRIVYHVAE
jgi:predicted  nucleic acid-binding Zn-ribbon protein